MDNFNLREFLAGGKLYEAMSPQDVVDIADTVAEEFTKESADEGDFLIYTVGQMDAADMSFELDTDASPQTPDSIDLRGVGEGWGGIFRIKPTANGYQVRNAEKGGLVAIIDNMGNFKMLSADEARAEMGRTKGEETDYMERRKEMSDYMEEGEAPKLNKMKKSELKEMIKSAFLGETEFGDALRKRAEEESFDDAFDRIDKEPDTYPGKKTLDPDYVKETLVDADQDLSESLNPEVVKAVNRFIKAMAKKYGYGEQDAVFAIQAALKQREFDKPADIPGFEGTMDALDSLSIREEEEEDVDVEAEEIEDIEATDVAVDDIETVDVEASSEISPEVKATQDALTAAIEAAKALGDQKLADQIGNSITFFTRTHVVGQDKVAETVDIFSERILKNAGIKK